VRYFLLFTVFLGLLPAFSQRYNFVNYSLEEGLPQSQVSDICQDRFGYLWIGTETGLSRFDGIEFENYSTDDGLPDNEINKLFLDSQNRLWIATPKGIAQYAKNGFISYSFSQDLIQEYNVNDFAELNGVLYIAADEGMLRFDQDKFELLPINSESPNSIRAILNIEDTSLFCATRNGLYQFNGHSFSVYKDQKLAGLNMSDIARRGDEIFISTYYAGLISLDLNSSVISTIATPVNRIRNIHVTKDAILCATKNGATEIGENSVFHYNLQMD
jgi:ligand-binding sensor domain-containing protein